MIIDTLNSKLHQLTHGTYSIGDGKEVIMLIGACRVIPYANYLHWLNAGNRFTIHLVNVVNFNFDMAGARREVESAIAPFEQNAKLIETIKSVQWFIHENTVNYGMFNTCRMSAKNIYQFGMNASVDLSIPNFDNVFVLFQDWLNFDHILKEIASRDLKASRKLSPELQERIRARGLERIQWFLNHCDRLSDFPEFGKTFDANWRTTRYFWGGPHISKAFTQEVFRMMNERYFHLDPTKEFTSQWDSYDPYANPATPITDYDVANYGIKWPQPVVPIKL